MSDFIDDEASEASSSDEESLDERQSRNKKGKKSKKKSREIIDSSEEEEEDEEEAEEEMKDLINDEEEEEDDEDSDDDEGGTKRARDDDEDDNSSSSLDEEDFDLINDNLGIRVEKKKKFKRIKTTLNDDDSEEEVDDGKRIQNELFPDAILESDEEDVVKQKSRPTHDLDLDVDDEEESDSDDNFIVDDNDQPLPRKPKGKKGKYTDSAMQQAQDVFGVDFDFDQVDDDDGYEDEEGYEEEYGEDGETSVTRPKKKKSGRKTIYDIYEPAELEKSHMTAFDQQIRLKDEPERFQLRRFPVTEATDEEIKLESEWIFQVAFDQSTISRQIVGDGEMINEPIAGKKSTAVIPEIHYALNCIRNEKLEVPFIASYRREYVQFLSNTFEDTKDLWTIYKYDEQWCRLQTSKTSMYNLYNDMRSYIAIRPHDPEGPSIRSITPEDLDRVNSVRSLYDLEDCRIHFKLYYSALVPEMKLSGLEEKIKEKRASREEAAAAKEKVISEDDDGENDEEENHDVQDEDKPVEEAEETEEEKLYKRLSRFKISTTRDTYQRCRLNRIGDLVSKFGLAPEQFGENLRDDYQRNSVGQHYTRPIEEAQNHIVPNSRFQTKEAVLKAANFMYSKEISSDPLVRKIVRKYYFENAVINIKPTSIGMKEIDENHPCYAFKFLKNKPVTRLVGDQFLHIITAEKDKLLEVHFSIEAVDSIDQKRVYVSPYHEGLKALYYSDFSSIVTKEWNEQRDEAIRTAMTKQLLPCFEKQLREKLVKEAQDKIIDSCSDKLHNWLNVAPYVPLPSFDEYEDFELRNGTRICGFTFAPEGDAPCFAAIIDADGELLDHVRLPYLNTRKRLERMNATERENHQKDRIKFKQFMINKKPHVVALAAETIQTKYICQDLATILDELSTNDGLPLIPIEIVDNELSNVYMNLKRANEEFPEFPPLLLQAISNARKLNDPLSEYSKLCGTDNDILCIRFHALQDDLPKEDLLDSLYQRFVTRTNAVGVDINRTIAHPHTIDLVQFLAGLGPRKGAQLVRSIKKASTGGVLVSRQQLVTELGMTSVIFINCAGFIKLDTGALLEDYPEEHITPLDSTRIHPQSYNLAKKIASDALDYDEDAPDETTANSVEEILEQPEKLDDLDLAAFARELDEVQNQGRKAITLTSIREEFQCRYKDHRESYRAPSQEEIFEMLTKETPQTFYQGKLITCHVVAIIRKKPGMAQLDMANPVKIDETNLWRCPFCMRSDFQDLSVVWNHFDTEDCPGYAVGIRCRLDNGLFGFIPTKNISDKEITDPSERVAVGQTIHARIAKIDSEKFSCELTCRSSDLLDEQGQFKKGKDEFYDENAEKNAKRELEAKSKRVTRRPYCKRVIVHPAFENIDYKACEKKLAEMEQGHAIIRPSSAGQNFLTVSWKVTDNINQHINIREEGKDNAFSLGHQLYIENESYEDLDEIIARYVQPMASFARELLNYKYCLTLPEETAEEELFLQETLHLEKQKFPQSFPYRFCASRKMPGKFLLGYMPKTKPRVEYLTVTPRGYRFRKLYFKNLASLIKWFKENWNKLPFIYPSVTPGTGYDNMSNPLSSLRQTFPMSQ